MHFEDKWCPNKSSEQKLLELFSIAEISATEKFSRGEAASEGKQKYYSR